MMTPMIIMMTKRTIRVHLVLLGEDMIKLGKQRWSQRKKKRKKQQQEERGRKKSWGL